MNLTTIHVFVGRFGSLEAARAYCERNWEQPREGTSAQEEQSESPQWPFAEELDAYLDEDFIELHFGPERAAAWDSFALDAADRERIEADLGADDTLLILDDNALGGFEVGLRSTTRLRYLGAFQARW